MLSAIFCYFSMLFCSLLILVTGDRIEVTGLTLQLPFLRCFGAKISRLQFDPKCHANTLNTFIIRKRPPQAFAEPLKDENVFLVERPFKKLEKLVIVRVDMDEIFRNYVNWYPNLRHLEMHFVNVRDNNPIIRPLENLEKLIIKDTDLANKVPCFVDWYPNLRHLELHDVDVDTDSIRVSLPHLEHLGIKMCSFTTEHIAKLLKANHQLQSIDIWMTDQIRIEKSLMKLLNMIRAPQSIPKFKVTLRYLLQN